MMVREPPPLRIRPRLEVGDRAAQQPVVVVGLVERGPGCLRSSQSTRGVSCGALPVLGTAGLWRTV